MKKRILLLIGLLCIIYGITPLAIAQFRPKYNFGNGINFHFITTDKRMMVRQPIVFSAKDTALYQVFDFLKSNRMDENIVPVSPIMLGIKLNPTLEEYGSPEIKSITKTYSGYVINDSSEAVLIAAGITKDNIKDYRYHVVENDSIEVVKWSKIPGLEQRYGAKRPYAVIGKFKSPGKQLLIEVVNIKDYSIRDGVLFDWRVNYKPVVTEIQVNTVYNAASPIYYFNLNYAKMNRGYATKFDAKTGMPLDFKFPVDSVTGLRLSFKNHLSIPYVIYITKTIAGKTDTSQVTFYLLENYYDIESKFFKQPGKYEIIIQRVRELGFYPEHQILRIPFEVKPPPLLEKKVSIKQTLPYLIATLTSVAILFLWYYSRNRLKLTRSVQEKQIAGLKLRSIRSQLNPHFMFNALTSIQNLINKKDIAGANHYLSKFAGLTRRVLDTGNEELLSLEEELTILDDYLQMEQLRFGFRFTIKVDEGLNRSNIDIPAMLLQPFVENAVKHGIAVLQDNGEITIQVIKEDKDIVFTVKDNGKGFTKSEDDSGYGLKLSEERVTLLNQLYKEQPVTLHIDGQGTGTVITIRLSNWI